MRYNPKGLNNTCVQPETTERLAVGAAGQMTGIAKQAKSKLLYDWNSHKTSNQRSSTGRMTSTTEGIKKLAELGDSKHDLKFIQS